MLINKNLFNYLPKKLISLIVIADWIGLVCSIAIAFTIAIIIQYLKEGTFDLNIITYFIFVYLFASIIKSFSIKYAEQFSLKASFDLKTKIRELIYKKLILAYLYGHADDFKTSKVMKLYSEGIDQLEIYFSTFIPKFIFAIIAPITICLVILPINPKIAISLLSFSVIIFIILFILGLIKKKKSTNIIRNYWNKYLQLADRFLDNISGIVTLKIFRDDEYKAKIINSHSRRFRISSMKLLSNQLHSITLIEILTYGFSGLGIIVAIHEYNKSNISLFYFILIILLCYQCFIPIRQLTYFFHIMMRNKTLTNEIFDFINLDFLKSKGSNNIRLTSPIEEIRFQNVSVKYNNNNNFTLKYINITIPAKKVTAIVGESGSGKSTIASLLLRLIKPTSGKIFFNGKLINLIDNRFFYKKITLVSNKSFLFRGTLKDNLIFHNKNYDNNKIIDILKELKLDSFLVNNLNFEIEEYGRNLSSGQIQKIALARAIILDPEIFVLDEVTSNIDEESEKDILNYIYNLKDKTIILITHKLSNTLKADTINLIDNSFIEESGTSKELIKANKIYASLLNKQKRLESIRNRKINRDVN